MLSKKIEQALNEQIAKEAYASNSYLSMASWSETLSLRGCAAFFHAQSEEERVHMLKLFKYVNESGGHAIVPALKEPASKFKDIQESFEISLSQEKEVTASISKLVELTFNSKDYSSFNFLQWYVSEQHEEENLFRTILDLVALAGKEGRNLLILDSEIAKMKETGESKE